MITMSTESGKVTQTFTMVVTRTFNASIGQLWKAWSESAQVTQWWGPKGFTAPIARIDFLEGGTSLVCMRAPKEFGGHDFYNTWTYTKIVTMQRIEFILNFVDKDGNKLDPAEMQMPPGIPQEVPHVITFAELNDGKAEMSVTEYGYTTAQARDISKLGLEQCLDKMQQALNPEFTDGEVQT
jgi:uncharacterized protein YndB with AHSA1/START domain